MSSTKNIQIQKKIQQANKLCQSGQFNQAKNLLEGLRKKNNMNAESFFLLGSIYGALNQYELTVSCYQEALNLKPNQPQVLFGLGKVYQQLGDLPAAEASYKEILKITPGYLEVTLELAIVLFSQNNLGEAEEYFSRVIETEPDSIKALFGLGRIYQTKNKLDLAKSYLQRAIQLNPKLVSAHYYLGKLFFDLSQLKDAEIHYKKVLEIDPGNIKTSMGMGYLNIVSNRVNEAEEWFEKVLSVQPDHLNAIAGMAKIHDQKGDVQKAYDLLEPYVKSKTYNADIGISFANICRHFDSCVDAAVYLEELLSQSEDNAANKQIHFSLGKIYDHLKNYDKAFFHYDKGNKYKPDVFNLIEESACIDKLIQICDWNYFISSPRSTQQTERPVFIVGMPRSGTTLTEQILATHPDLSGIGEVDILPGIIKDLPEYLGKGSTYPENLKNITTQILDVLSSRYLSEVEKLDKNTKRIADKTLANYLYLGLISQMFPNAKIIHCKRDPRDICLSIYFQNFDDSHYYATRLENLGHYYRLYERIMQHWKSLIKIPIYEIQYEELVGNQEKISRELINYVGLDWNDCVLDFHKTKRSVITASYDQVRQKIYTKSTARWKNYEEHIKPLVKALKI